MNGDSADKTQTNKVEIIFNDKDSVRLLSGSFKDSFKKRVILALIGSLTVIVSIFAIIESWESDIETRELQRKEQLHQDEVNLMSSKIKQQEQVNRQFNAAGTELRNVRDLIIASCQYQLSSVEHLALFEKRLNARKNVVIANYKIEDAFPSPINKKILAGAMKFVSFDEGVVDLCESHRPPDKEWKKRQNVPYYIMRDYIEGKKKDLEDFIRSSSSLPSKKR